jgi:hypothetical protein
MSDKFRCMALCTCGWATSRSARTAKERVRSMAMKELTREAWKHARDTGHTVEVGDVAGESRQITPESPEP